jgi:berberine-like enzyme
MFGELNEKQEEYLKDIYASGTHLLNFLGPPPSAGGLVQAFQKGLRDLGYIEGQNIRIEYRYTDVALQGIAAIMVCHAGGLEAGAAAVAPVKRFVSPVMDVIGPMPYSAVNTLFDAGFPRGALNYWKSSFLATLADGAIDTMIERFAAAPSPMSGLLLEHFHGAATRVGPTDTAFPHRTVAHNFLAVAEWLEASATQANVAWARDTYAALAPHFASGRYANYLNAEEVTQSGAVSDAFGPNWKRLREVKERIDPDNVFHLNQNIKP